MLLPLIVLSYFILTNKKNLERVLSKEQIKRLVIKQNPLGSIGQNILLFASLLLFIIALARPVIPQKEVTLSTKPLILAILLDISNSTRATDVYPNRFEFAKKRVEDFLDLLDYVKVSIYAYSDNLFMISAQTFDKKILKYLIKNFHPLDRFRNSSNLYNALSHIKEKNIVIFSDGEHIKNITELKSLKKNIYIYLIGTKKGSPIKIKDRYLLDKNKNIVIAKVQTDVKELGKVIKYSYNKANLISLIPKKEIKQTYNITKKRELFYYPLFLALLLLIINFFSLPRFKIFPIIILIMFYNPSKSQALIFDFYYIKKAQNAYLKGDFKVAIKNYKKILNSNKTPQIYFNLANSYYKIGEYKKAIKLYKIVDSMNDDLLYKKYFNIANAYFMLKKYKNAYQYYKLAKEIKQTKKVLHNLQIAKSLLKGKIENLSYINSAKINFSKDSMQELSQKSIMLKITNKEVSDEISW